jgi:nucleoside-diphosphate-sugar epimerase
MTQALTGKPMTVYGDGSQTRSFCYVSDLVRGIYLMMQGDVKGEVVNLGNPNEMTVLEFAKKIKALTKSTSTIEFRPLPENDPLQRRPDISKAKKLLGWKPEVGLDEGLKLSAEYFKDKLQTKAK